MRRAASFAALAAGLVLATGCGPKAVAVGSRPFPAGRPVFSDASGRALDALPAAGDQVRLVFLEFPWCPACGDVWRSMRTAFAPFPPGTVRISRRSSGLQKDSVVNVSQVATLERSTLTGIVADGAPLPLPVGARVTLWAGPNVVFVGKAIDESHVLDLLSTESDEELHDDESI